MSIRDYKITDAQIAEKGVIASPDTLTGTADENKRVFDRLVRECVAPQFNEIVETFADMEESTTEWSGEEAKRQQAEQGRVSAETARVSAEDDRAQAESARDTAETARQQTESARDTAETARANAENKRDTAEKSRASAENARNVWQTYDAAKTYVPGNKVSFGGSSYLCTAATVGHEPTDTAYWLLIAQKGADGAGADDLRRINDALDAVDPTKITTKAEPADDDGVMIADSADGGKAKRLLWSSVKEALGKLFVPLTRKVNGKVLTEDVTLTGENIAVSTTDSTPISGAVKYRTNPNLLDNWYFGRPVNQRGQTEHASGNWDKYFIDRWIATSSDCAYAITEDGVKISNLPHKYNQIFLQKLDSIEKRPYTLSFLLKDVGLLSATFTPEGSDYKDFYLGGFVLSFQSEENLANPRVRILDTTSSTVSSVTILAAKLELGDTQTLAHKENGVWMLNEIPDFGEQLRRCMYYAEKVEDGNTPVITNATFIPAGATSATFVLPYERKRTYPSIRFNDVSNYRVIARSMSGNIAAFGISNISILDVGTTKASVLVTFSSAKSQDVYGYLQQADNTTGGYAFISADL